MLLRPGIALIGDLKREDLNVATPARVIGQALVIAIDADALAADLPGDPGLLQRFSGRCLARRESGDRPALWDNPTAAIAGGNKQDLQAARSFSVGQSSVLGVPG